VVSAYEALLVKKAELERSLNTSEPETPMADPNRPAPDVDAPSPAAKSFTGLSSSSRCLDSINRRIAPGKGTGEPAAGRYELLVTFRGVLLDAITVQVR
jgi:hypothetical protein